MSTATPKTGYPVQIYNFPTKRYCQTLDLVDDPQLIEEYKQWHESANFWKEIKGGLRAIGVLEMEIYLIGTRMFMVVETAEEFDWEKQFGLLAEMERQAEWEAFVSKYQKAEPGASSTEKWRMMERIFTLPE